jgi:hypothetical protein
MKILSLLLLLSSQTLMARTGTESFSYSIKAETEQELLYSAEKAIPLIQSGKLRSPFQRDCWPNNPRTIKVKSVSVKKYYSVQSDNSLIPYYTGSIHYLHKKCKQDK